MSRFKLQGCKARVESAFCHQSRVVAFFNNAALIHHENAIRFDDG